MPPAVPAIAAGVTALGAIGGGLISSHASSNAAKMQAEQEDKARAAQKEASDKALEWQQAQMETEYQQQLKKATAWHSLLARYGIDLGPVGVAKPPTLGDLASAQAAAHNAAPVARQATNGPAVPPGATLGTLAGAPAIAPAAPGGIPSSDDPGAPSSDMISPWRGPTPVMPPVSAATGSMADPAYDEMPPPRVR